MKKANVIKLKRGIIPGEVIPFNRKNYGGSIGRWVEDELQRRGYKVNRGYGPDLKEMDIEVKTRLESSTSAHTVTAMRGIDIVYTPWEQSNVRDKIQKQYRVYYNDLNVVTDRTGLYDFTDPYIQELLKVSYEYGRSVLQQYVAQFPHGSDIDASVPNYIRKDKCIAYFEEQPESGWFGFRISDCGMRKIETMTRQTSFTKFFTFEESIAA